MKVIVVLKDSDLGMSYPVPDKYHSRVASHAVLFSEKKCTPSFTDKEKSEGMTLNWVSITEAIHLLENSTPETISGKFIITRDFLFLKEAQKLISQSNSSQ